MTPEQTDMGAILSEMASGACLSPSAHVSHRQRMEVVMRHFADKKIPLATCCDRRHLKRSLDTLKRYAREFGLQFPDYVPRALRKPAEASKA